MGGSPSKRAEQSQAQDSLQNQNKGMEGIQNQKERSVSLPLNTYYLGSASNQKTQITPIKSNRSVTVSYNQAHPFLSSTYRVPTANTIRQPPRTIFTDHQERFALSSSNVIKTSISNLETSQIDYQNKIPIVHQNRTPFQTETIPSRLKVTLTNNNNNNNNNRNQQISSQASVIAQSQQQRSNMSTPQKQVPKIVQQNGAVKYSLDDSLKASPYQALKNAVIYEMSSNSNNNSYNSSGAKGINVTSKVSTQVSQLVSQPLDQQVTQPQLLQTTQPLLYQVAQQPLWLQQVCQPSVKQVGQPPSISQMSQTLPQTKQSHSLTVCNQPNVNVSRGHTPLQIDLDYQNTIRTTVSHNCPSENIRILDFLQKNKGTNPQQNSIPANASTQGNDSIGGENSTVLSAMQNGSYYFSQNHPSSRQVQQNYLSSFNVSQNKAPTTTTTTAANNCKDNILIVDRSSNTARISSNTARVSAQYNDDDNASALKYQSSFKESSSKKDAITNYSEINQQRNNVIQQDKNQQQQINEDKSQTTAITKQSTPSIPNNNSSFNGYKNNSTSIQNSQKIPINNYDNLSTQLTQKKEINTNTQQENNLIQQETEKKYSVYNPSGIVVQSIIQQSQQQNMILLSPLNDRLANKTNGIIFDDQISFMYSATENKKQNCNSVNKSYQKNNYAMRSNNFQNSVDSQNQSNIIFQNSSIMLNNSNQMMQKVRTNNFFSKDKPEERQLVIKLEDLYKNMDSSISNQNPNSSVQKQQPIPTVSEQIQHLTLPINQEQNSLHQRSFSQSISSASLMRASQNFKGEEHNNNNNYTSMNNFSDKKNNILLTTSVTQLPAIQQFYFPVNSVKKMKQPQQSNIIYVSSQPSVSCHQRSQSFNQSTQYVGDTTTQFDSAKKEQRYTFHSVDQSNQSNGGIFLLKNNMPYQRTQPQIVQNRVTVIQPTIQSISLPKQSVQVPHLISNITTNLFPISQAIHNQQVILQKQKGMLENKKEPIQSYTTLEQRQVEQSRVNQNFNHLVQQIGDGDGQNINKIYIQNPFGTKEDAINLSPSQQEGNSIINKQQQVQNAPTPITDKRQELVQNRKEDQYIIQQSQLQSNYSNKNDLGKEDEHFNTQVPHINISIIPKSNPLQDSNNNNNNNRVQMSGNLDQICQDKEIVCDNIVQNSDTTINNNKHNNDRVGKDINQQQNNIERIHLKQKEEFQINTQKLKQKFINHSSAESFVETSSIGKDQSSSCEEFKNFINFGNETCDKQKLNKDIQKEYITNKNYVRVSDSKQEQSNSFTTTIQTQNEATLNLQDHIVVKLESALQQNNIQLYQQNQNQLQLQNNIKRISPTITPNINNPNNLNQQYEQSNPFVNNKNNISYNQNSQQEQSNPFINNNNNSNNNNSINNNNYSFQINQNNYQSINPNNNTTFDFQLTRTDDEMLQNNLHTIIDEDDALNHHLIQSQPKKRLHPHDDIHVYLNLNSESSQYSSVQSDFNEKEKNKIPLVTQEIRQTQQFKIPMVNYKDANKYLLNKENNERQIKNLNNQQNNQIKQKKQNNYFSYKIPDNKHKKQHNEKNQLEMIRDMTNEKKIRQIIHNELNVITQETYPSDNNNNHHNNSNNNHNVNASKNELFLLEAQDNCKKTLQTYQNLIDLEDQRKSPKEFDKENNESSNPNLLGNKRFLTQYDQEEEECGNNYNEVLNSMQSQSINSQTGIPSHTPFRLSKQQIFSSVNSYNLHNSTIIKKVNNKYQALSSTSQNVPTEHEIQTEKRQPRTRSNIHNDTQDDDGNEIFFKYCKKTGTLVPLSHRNEKTHKKQQQQYFSQNKSNQQSNSKKSIQGSSSQLFCSQNTSQHKRSSSSIPPSATNQQKTINLNSLYNNQYEFSKNNSNLYTDVLEKYSRSINKKALEQKSKLQQTHGNKNYSKTNAVDQTKRKNLRV